MIQLSRGKYFGAPGSTARIAGLAITEAIYEPKARVPRHAHEADYLCLVVNGGFEERSGHHAVSCGPGSVIWHPAGEVHEDRFGSHGGACLNIEFTDEWVPRLDASRGGVAIRMRGDAASWLAGRIIDEMSLADSASSLAVEGLVCVLLSEVHRSASHNGCRQPPWLERAVERIRAEYRGGLTMGELSEHAGVHRSHFARVFHSHMGCTVAEFIRRLRADWAAAELTRPDGPGIAELSLLAGFSDQAHFTRTFKRVTGHTPAAYRARHR